MAILLIIAACIDAAVLVGWWHAIRCRHAAVDRLRRAKGLVRDRALFAEAMDGQRWEWQ